MLLLFSLFALLLLGGSFYPWALRPGPPLLEAVRGVAGGWQGALERSSPLDVLVNCVIYIPIGFTGWLWTGWRNRLAATLGALLAGASLSFAIETLQHYFAGRAPSPLDVACNTASTAAGIAAAAALARSLDSRHIEWRRYSTQVSSALLLLAVWAASFGWPAHPPPLGAGGRLRALLRPGAWEPADTLWGAVPWFVTGRLVAAVTGPRDARWWIWPLLLGSYGVMAISPGHGYTWSHFAGSVAAAASFALLPEAARVRGAWLAWVWLAWLAADGLQPYKFLAAPHRFHWLPFRDLLAGNWMEGIGVLLRQTWMYGAAYWLLAHSRAGAQAAGTVLLATVLVIEAAQMWLPGRTAGSTGAAIALLAALLVHYTDRHFQRQA